MRRGDVAVGVAEAGEVDASTASVTPATWTVRAAGQRPPGRRDLGLHTCRCWPDPPR